MVRVRVIRLGKIKDCQIKRRDRSFFKQRNWNESVLSTSLRANIMKYCQNGANIFHMNNTCATSNVVNEKTRSGETHKDNWERISQKLHYGKMFHR